MGSILRPIVEEGDMPIAELLDAGRVLLVQHVAVVGGMVSTLSILAGKETRTCLHPRHRNPSSVRSSTP